MEIIKTILGIIGKVIKFIYNAFWLALGCVVLAAYGYVWWLDREEEQAAEERTEFVEAEVNEYKNRDLGDEQLLLAAYKADCLNDISLIKDISQGDESALCDAAADLLLETSKKTGMSLDDFDELSQKICMREEDDDAEGCADQGDYARNEAVEAAIAMSLCDIESALVISDNDSEDNYSSWQLSKRGKNVYQYQTLFVDCQLKKFSDIGYQGFFDQVMSEEEQYPDYPESLNRFWELVEDNKQSKIESWLEAHTFGEDEVIDNLILQTFVTKEQSQLLPKVLELSGNQVNFDIDYYDQPLHKAIENENSDAALALIAAGADSIRTGDSGSSPISMAAEVGMLEVVEALLDKGADADGLKGAENLNFAGPISAAALYGHAKVVTLLLERGAQLKPANPADYPDWSSQDLLSTALYGGNLSVVKKFVEGGLTFDEPARSIDQAIGGGSSEVLAYLFEQGATMPKPEDHHRLYGNVLNTIKEEGNGKIEDGNAMLRMLLERGLDMSRLSSNGSSYAHQAIVFYAPNNILPPKTERGKQKYSQQMKFTARVVVEVLKAGVDINQQDSDGYTMLMHAVDRSHPRLVKYFIDKGADQTLKNDKAQTALDIAIKEGRRQTRGWTRNKLVRKNFTQIISLLGGDPAALDEEVSKS